MILRKFADPIYKCCCFFAQGKCRDTDSFPKGAAIQSTKECLKVLEERDREAIHGHENLGLWQVNEVIFDSTY